METQIIKLINFQYNIKRISCNDSITMYIENRKLITDYEIEKYCNEK